MADLLDAQAAIKRRYKAERDKAKPVQPRKAGKFVNPESIRLEKLVADRMKAALDRDTDAMHHAEGKAYVKGHLRPLPGTAKLAQIHAAVVGESPAPLPSLFDRAA